MGIETKSFGTTGDGTSITLFRLTNSLGHSVELIDFGATIVSVNVPDRSNRIANVNLGFESIDGYLQRHPYFGSTVGRVCNRIANGTFQIDGVSHSLATNLGDHHLHGGLVGFDALPWKAETFETDDSMGVRMRLVSPDGQEGFPGTLTVDVEFAWNDQNELQYQFSASTDAATHVNLTNHAYWNLAGAGAGKVYDHETVIEADQALGVDADLIPTGTLEDLDGSPLDFRTQTAIGDRIDQLPETLGYDHCYAVRGSVGSLRLASRTVDPASGRSMDVLTTQPGVQLYTGNHLSGQADAGGFGQHEAFCFETQHFPDAANQPNFKSTLLLPGEKLDETTVHRFGVVS